LEAGRGQIALPSAVKRENGNFMLVFFDESGDSGMKGKPGSSLFFVVTAVLFEDHDEANKCEQAIKALRNSKHLNDKFEFHFNSCSDELRQDFLSAISRSGFFYHSVVLNKAKLWGKGFQDKHSFYKYAVGLVFENAKKELVQAKIVVDKCGNREFLEQLSKYLKRKMNTEGKLIKKVSMEGSHSNDLLQLADMVCGAVARSFNMQKQNRMVFRKIVRHRELRVQVWPK
jgi:hypothetical protein